MVNNYKCMDSSKAIIITGSIFLFIFLTSSFLVSSKNNDLTGKAFEISQKELQISEKGTRLKYFNEGDYPLTDFEQTSDYQKMKIKSKGILFGPTQALVPYQYYIIISPTLFDSLEEEIVEYKQDVLEDTGYHTKIVFCDSCTQEEMRNTLIAGYNNDLKGALLIGDIPVAWCNFTVGTNYPTPYYYMDLDGIWEDTNQDYIFDTHTGNTDPEIFVSWLKSNDLTLIKQTEVDILQNYFQKVHNYRGGELDFGFKSLYLRDDVFSLVAKSDYMEQFPFVQEYSSLITTSSLDYESYLDEEYQTVYTLAHSNPWLHGFSEEDEQGQGCEWYNGGVCYNSVQNTDIIQIEPKSLFYFLHGCAVGRFTEQDNIANWYIFQQEGGLVTIAPTEPIMAGPEIFENYLSHLLDKEIFGISYLDHIDSWEKYTLTLLGDPTLKLNPPEFFHRLEVSDGSYTNEDNLANVSITGSGKIGTEPIKAKLKIYLNGDILNSYDLKVNSEDQFIEFEFQPEFGTNTLEACLKSKSISPDWICLEKETYGSSAPIVIGEDNTVLDCEKQGLNPLIGNLESPGIIIENKDNIQIKNCDISNFLWGILMADSENILIEDNEFHDFEFEFGSTISGTNSNNIQIKGNNFEDFNYGISLSDGGEILIQNNQFENSLIKDIGLSYDNNSIIKANTFSNSFLGISLFYSENTQIQGNIFIDCVSGLYSGMGDGVIIQGNDFLGESNGSSIELNYGSNNIIQNNFICAESLEEQEQFVCTGSPVYENPESIGNNLDTAIQCYGDWPIYQKHYLYCDEKKKNEEKQIISRR